MAKFCLITFGIIVTIIGWLLVKRFEKRANHSGIGSFTLMPFAGIAYIAGILCIIKGTLLILFGLFI